MIIDFSRPEDAEKRLEKVIQKPLSELDEVEIRFRGDQIVEDLYNAMKVLESKLNWVQNTGITNKKEQKQEFLDAWESADNDFRPDWRFKTPQIEIDTALKVIERCKHAADRINEDTMKKYGAKQITPTEFQKMWKNIFREFRLYIEIADNIESYNKWRKKCLKVWPIDEDQIQESIDLLEHGIDTETEEKTLHAEDLKQMWEEELDRIDVEYEVQVRNVPGCFNIPEEQTVVVAKGRGDERLYSESEAKILTMHELFHVVRAYNGRKAGEKSGLPPFLGIRTPFYDRTEEGGAVYREIRTGVITSEKEFDYHLRAVAAYYVAEGLGFMEAAEKLVDLGGKPERAFELLARNREILRHHIYMAGVAEWKKTDNLDKLLVGKVNSEYAELFWKEVEAEGMLEKPPVTAEQVFDYGF